ncbi:hypothetical protein BJ875DRAFT_139952 [Amylocarpus encephaloides]|uniref:Uncharacterized protein n=1 Tax=Amylocarpus encephaloides TaxID=45428 RepID=A0A9P8C2A5_9HELO|nr:hypothetical protein BJ875DRAFT_139952 [Amylocarpus encephaloides]
MSWYPEIFFLSLNLRSDFDDAYHAMFESIDAHGYLHRQTTVKGALQHLNSVQPQAIIVSDEGLTKKGNEAMLEQVKNYVKEGGRVIFAFDFPKYVDTGILDTFFIKTFELPWTSGCLQKKTVTFNHDCLLPVVFTKCSFPNEYTRQSLHVSGAREYEKVFAPRPFLTVDSRTHRAVDDMQAAVVGARIREGFVAYVGDIEPIKDDGFVLLILRLCGFK